jgi:hypothetical protein
MKPEEFVRQVAAIAPDTEAIAKLGMDLVSIEEFRKSYVCVQRQRPLETKGMAGAEDLIELFNHWDPGAITIGMIQFASTPLETSRGLQIGLDEADPLPISPANGGIIVEQAETRGHQLGEVSENANKFLDPMVIAGRFLTERAVGSVSFEDLAAAKLAARRCAVAAGGERYLSFYLYLLGANE